MGKRKRGAESSDDVQDRGKERDSSGEEEWDRHNALHQDDVNQHWFRTHTTKRTVRSVQF